MHVVIETIDHAEHRYSTCGDWTFDEDGSLTIRVSRLPDERYEFLIALHELLEAMLCKASGVSQESVDAFDVDWLEGNGQPGSEGFLEDCVGLPGEPTEPGDSPRAPYHRQHSFATIIEMMVAHELGVRWEAYSAAVDELGC